MLKNPLLVFLFCFSGIIATNTAFAQAGTDSSVLIPPLYANVVNNFYTTLGPQSRLYDGKRYELYDHTIIGNAYFMDVSDWRQGSVVYDGFLYKNVDMLYDIFKDVLVIRLYNSFLKISLVSTKVSSFDIADHHYVYIANEPANSNSLSTGFYDELYGGKIKVLAKRKKTLQSTHNFTGSIDSYFTGTSTDYYVFKNGIYYSFSSQSSFLNILKDHKKEVQQYIKTNKIKYRKMREQAMAMIAGYYDHLPN